MPNIQVNLSALVEQPIEYGWDKKSGNYAVRRWVGTQALCAAQKLALQGAPGFSSVSLKQQGGGTWVVEGRIDAAVDDNGNPLPEQDIVDTWELQANRAEKDLLESDISAVNSLTQNDIEILRAVINGSTEYDQMSIAWTSSAPADPGSLYKLIKAGVKQVAIYAPVLSKTQTASDSRVIASALTNVGKVWKSESLLAAEAVPASIANNLPASSTRTQNGLTFQYGWLKNFPVITDTVDGKVQLQQNWEYGLWSNILYTVI